MASNYEYHPIFTTLKINEDGTRCYFNGRLLRKTIDPKKPHQIRYNFDNRTVTAAKLVIECWHGMRLNLSYSLKRIDFDKTNSHYTNLYWGIMGGNYAEQGANLSAKTKKAIKMLADGKTNKEIQTALKMDRRRLHTIKKKYINGEKK